MNAAVAELAAAVAAALTGAGIGQAPVTRLGQPLGEGFTVDELPAPCGGRPRVAVRWHPAASPPAGAQPAGLSAELTWCQKALDDAGYLLTVIHGTDRPYLSVIPSS